MKNNFFQVKDFKHGTAIKGFYICKNINCKITRLGDEYVDLFLEDSTGSIRAKIWSNVNFYKNKLDRIYPVAVKGKVISYNDNLEIDITFIKSINNSLYDKYGYNKNLLFKYSDKEIDKNLKELFNYIKLLSIEYQKISERIILKYKNEIVSIPSLNQKYSCKGGFLIQLINLLDLNSKIYKKYSLELDKSTIGIIFKNIGLVKYYSNDILFTVSEKNIEKGCKLLGIEILDRFYSKKNGKIIDFMKKNIINDTIESGDIHINYISNIYEFDSKVNI